MCAKWLKTEAKIVSYGQKDADFWLKDTNWSLEELLSWLPMTRGKEKEVRVKTKLIGRHFGRKLWPPWRWQNSGDKGKEAAQT